jgi:tRNA A-37 threonylcarbamoyl transferase component Bud32
MPEPLSSVFPSVEELGNSLLQYEIQEQIQEETESAVYKARQPALDRQVMIRVLTEPAAEAATRLMERLRSRARLVHPRIVAVYDFGRTHAGHLYLITEHVDGRLLCDLIHERQITPKLAYTLALQLCDALSLIHENNTIHGALNTRTLLVDHEWQMKLTGIGMAENETGELSWLHEAQSSIEDDLYALGAVLHEMFGKEPLPEDARVSRNLPPTFAAVIRRCVHPEVARRFTSATEVKEALIGALRSEKQKALPALVPGASPAPIVLAAEPSAPSLTKPPRYAHDRPPTPVQRAQPSFAKKLDDFLWACLRASLHLMIFAVAAGILFVSYLLKDKIIIGDQDSATEEPAFPAEVLGKLPDAPILPESTSIPMSKPIELPAADPVAALNADYQTAVQNEASTALEKVRLDDLPFIQKELLRIQKGEPLPATDDADIPASLKRLRDDYRRKRAAIGP